MANQKNTPEPQVSETQSAARSTNGGAFDAVREAASKAVDQFYKQRDTEWEPIPRPFSLFKWLKLRVG
ncbi:MAG: hypothetical protein H6831_04450 [Planctomycetes bacterium]|nr:hypothetical protein [Planctomycetota bacterium]MCB9903639.1 hypothetical protein [Planctomycetota bacterium]